MTDYEAEREGPEAIVEPYLYLVFPEGVPDGGSYQSSKYYGTTRYEISGYFSGRMIDYYDLTAVYGVRQERIGGEEEEYREERHPEFCVESWCYRPDPDPVLSKEVKSAAEIASDRAEYARILKDMKRAGARMCPASAPVRR